LGSLEEGFHQDEIWDRVDLEICEDTGHRVEPGHRSLLDRLRRKIQTGYNTSSITCQLAVVTECVVHSLVLAVVPSLDLLAAYCTQEINKPLSLLTPLIVQLSLHFERTSPRPLMLLITTISSDYLFLVIL
jgi:hypothetical protein